MIGHVAQRYGSRDGRTPLVRPATIPANLARAAARWGPRPCLRVVDPAGAVSADLTYAGLLGMVRERADQLRREGARPATSIGLIVRNSLASVIDVLAVLELGASAVLVDARESEERRRQQFQRICHSVLEPRSGKARLVQRTPDVEDPAGSGWRRTALIVYTTGSTADSKAVAQSHHAVAVNVVATVRHHRLREGEVMACALPISHVNGLHFGLLATLLSGGCCVLFEAFEPLTYLGVIRRERATRATTVPSLLSALLDVPRWPALPDLRYLVSAAAPLPAGVAAGLLAAAGIRVVQGYGLSECMNFATTMPVRLGDAAYRRHVIDAEIPPVGHELFGCEVAVRDAADADLPPGRVGEVLLRGASLMTRYVGNPEATTEALGGGWLRTGDLGRLDLPASGHGPWLTLMGRIKNVAKCGGLSVSLDELDRWLRRLPALADACCVARPDARRGEAVTAFYVARAGAAAAAPEVVGHLERLVDRATTGLRAVAIAELPRLRSGKVDRRRLRELAGRPG